MCEVLTAWLSSRQAFRKLCLLIRIRPPSLPGPTWDHTVCVIDFPGQDQRLLQACLRTVGLLGRSVLDLPRVPSLELWETDGPLR